MRMESKYEWESRLTADQQYWWKTIKPSFSGLLSYASCTPKEVESNLYFLAEEVIPGFGEQPSKSTTDAFTTQDASPLEVSLNFSSGGKSKVRFSFSPCGGKVGTAADPLGNVTTAEMLPRLEAAAHKPDMRWSRTLDKVLFLTDEDEVARATAVKERFGLPGIPSFVSGFHFDGTKRVLKTYHFLMPKNAVLSGDIIGRGAEPLLFDAIRSLPSAAGSLAPAADALQKYLETACADVMPLDLVGIDCVDHDAGGARVKVYGHTQTSNAWDVVRHINTLGDDPAALADPVRTEGLEVLHSVYHLLRGEQAPLPDDVSKPMVDPASFHRHVVHSFEMVPGWALPEVKTYVPVWQYAPTDRAIARNLSAIFSLLGWDEAAATYEGMLARCFPWADLDATPARLHTYVSFAYSDKTASNRSGTGAYMTSYLSTSGRSFSANANGVESKSNGS